MTLSDEIDCRPLEPRSSDKKPPKGFAAREGVFVLTIQTLDQLFQVCRCTEHNFLRRRYSLFTGVRHFPAHSRHDLA